VAAGSLLPGAGAGLVGLRERVQLVGGRLWTGPTPDGGWRVEAWLPWADGRETSVPPVPDLKSVEVLHGDEGER
jgi:hypothetical protein